MKLSATREQILAPLQSVIGVVERAWVEDGKGFATVRFSQRADVDVTVERPTASVLLFTFRWLSPSSGQP